MTMATRIVVMKDGKIQQVDTPQNLYDKPNRVFVAGFIGTPQMNFIESTLTQSGSDVYIEFAGNKMKLPADKASAPELKEYIGKEVIVGIRPECIHDEEMYLERLSTGDEDARNILIERNLRLVAHVCKKYSNSNVDQDDLISIGTIGLIKGINSFKPENGARLSTYVSRCIDKTILSCWNQRGIKKFVLFCI